MTYRTLLTLSFFVLFTVEFALAQQDDHRLGEVEFAISCNAEAQEHFQLGLAQLHHMMYEQARPHFKAAAEADAECAMAHWGIAMTSFYPLWSPTPQEGLERGTSAIEEARAIGAHTEREGAYIGALEAFFTDPVPAREGPSSDHEARLAAWTEAQREVHEAYAEDVDAAAFHALAEVSHALMQFSPDEEHDYARERQAGALLEDYLEDHPEHPGLHHYLIHAYDSQELARRGEDVARAYDQLAPQTPHALHMPTHILVRLGEWEEMTELNERSAEAALRQSDADPHAMGHYVHALDYMMYGYLQLGDETSARETLDRVQAIEDAPPDVASAYGIAASQARYYLERRQWDDAAALESRMPEAVRWDDFPEAEALFAYARGLGAARSGDLSQAETERDLIETTVRTLHSDDEDYWAYTTEALGQAIDAWIHYEKGETEHALELMGEAADLEDSMDKHPTTPGEILPVRELYGEMLLMEDRPQEARDAVEASHDRTPNRRYALRLADRTEQP